METTTREIIRKNKKNVKTAGAAAARHGAAVLGPIMSIGRNEAWTATGLEPRGLTSDLYRCAHPHGLVLGMFCLAWGWTFGLEVFLTTWCRHAAQRCLRASVPQFEFQDFEWTLSVASSVSIRWIVPHRSTLCYRHHQCPQHCVSAVSTSVSDLFSLAVNPFAPLQPRLGVCTVSSHEPAVSCMGLFLLFIASSDCQTVLPT